MLVNLNEVLLDAKKNHYGVGLFNTINLEMARAVLEAAEELRSPVIVGTAEILLPAAELVELRDILIPMAERASVPVVLHFDHGLTEEKVIEALRLGYSSVMYDCSADTYEDNQEKVKRMTEIVHAFGATIEAELGHVGSNQEAAEGSGKDDSIYTEPDQAAAYVNATGVDALAVAVGSSHGAYKKAPKLDFERLREIEQMVDVPLVLHGGSGLTDDDFRNCIKNGIAKINIFTDINCAGAKAAYDQYESGKGLFEIAEGVRAAVKAETMKKMLIFGSDNKAS